ncbi:RHS repeat-associated protein [Xanthomonas arboricola]|uniref:RHS repeat domain-containing protein n=1 Tax=Xanthomonas sp. 3793 TaxID=3035312 RepID=UPI002166C8A5|nr:RHS repeat-associated core domain-containing protein [Xanthomonas sp. 3793]MCS3746398.1 RHS repeat-associated protein [Xanthomonas sp. 3793]
MELPAPVSIDSNVTFNFNVTAPTTPGQYQFVWRMLQEGTEWFGAFGSQMVQVIPSLIKGNIDSVTYGSISGWACSTYLNRSVDVHMYLGGPAGSGTFAGATAATLPSDSGIASACSASGSNYRFSFPIDENFIIQNGGKPIYIHGLSPVGASNDTISGSGAVAVPASVIKGRIDGIQDNKAIVGWACSAGLRRSIDVHLYAGGPAGTGAMVASAAANLSSEAGVASACSSSGNNYRFSIPISEDLIRSYGGKPFYIHGISPLGGANSLIDGSGVLAIPAMQRSAMFVSQNMPGQLSTGRSVSGSVRFTNTGNITWRQGQGYRVVLVGDTRGWSPGEVSLPSDVAPGASVDFNFNLRAPLAAGGYNLRWRMRDSAGDIGNESSNQVVQVVAPPPVEHGVGLAARSYVYDANQQLCKVIEPETGATVMAYDAAGNLAWSASGLDLPSTTSCDLDAAANSGRRVARTYDTRNRLKTLRFPDRNGDQDWDYTPDGLPSRVSTVNDAGNTTVVNVYNYNKRRQLLSEVTQQPGVSWSFGYGYDANGALASQSYPTGTTVTYAPNALGQPTGVRDQAGNNYATGIAYYPNGAASQFTYGNGVNHSLVLNGRQMPQQVRDYNVASFEYQYDANGNVTGIFDQQRGESLNRYMGYDGLDRLMEAGSARFGGDHWNRYTYDVLDNILTAKLPGVSENNYWYDSKNRLTNIQNNAGATVIGLGYDVQGNLKNKNGQAFVFDYGNRLRDATGKEAYRYDAYGRRVLSGGLSTLNVQAYSQAGQLLYAEVRGKGNTEYVYLNGSLLATRNAGAIKFQHTDALGSPIAVTDAAGQVVERTDYQPYGSPIGKTVDGIGYTGHAMDGVTGLTYMQQRYYDQDLGRFLSVDPVAADSVLAANFNRYWYANNNPYRFTDPDGRISCEICSSLVNQAKSAATHLVVEKSFAFGRALVGEGKSAVDRTAQDVKNFIGGRDAVVTVGGSGMIGGPLIGNGMTPGVTLVADAGVVANLSSGQLGLQGNVGFVPSIGGGSVVSGNFSIGLNEGPLQTGISQTNTAFAQVTAVTASGTPVDVGGAVQWSSGGGGVSAGFKPGIGSYIGVGGGTLYTGAIVTPPLRDEKD